MKRIAVLSSGGDSPGMNAAIRAVTRTGLHFGLEVFGFQLGFQGIVDQKLSPLHTEDVANCIQLGGTILKADRCLAFYQQEVRAQCRAYLQSQKIDGLVVLGGNGSIQAASLFASEDKNSPAVIGIPCTIDNDITGTSYTLGFDTARNTALQAIDRIRDTASSHNRHFLIEVMGRRSGFLAVDVGIAGGAEIILIPEVDFPLSKVADKLRKRRSSKLSSIIIVAEADKPGRSIKMAEELHHLTDLPFRVCILGHIQRGGSPTTLDRKLASTMGYFAVKALLEGEKAKMLSYENDRLGLVPFPSTEENERSFSETELLEINSILCT